MSRRRSRVALSIGCPCGIGPEVSVVAALESKDSILLVGDLEVIRAAARRCGLDPHRFVAVDAADDSWPRSPKTVGVHSPSPLLAMSDCRPGKPTRNSGVAQLLWINTACDLVSRSMADAMVTGPVSKDVIAQSGAKGARKFTGHTEHLARRLGANEVVMAFWNERFTTSLVTTHLPLSRVPTSISKTKVASSIYWTAEFLARIHRKRRTSLAVAALNPHAGEGGLLGNEEERIICPGIVLGRERLRGMRVDVEGPVPTETAFRLANAGKYDGVVAMYHDQATIPMKLVGFGESVNVTLGLPIIRTSVDHGTAYDLAGRGKADATGMREAIALAVRLGGVG